MGAEGPAALFLFQFQACRATFWLTFGRRNFAPSSAESQHSQSLLSLSMLRPLGVPHQVFNIAQPALNTGSAGTIESVPPPGVPAFCRLAGGVPESDADLLALLGPFLRVFLFGLFGLSPAASSPSRMNLPLTWISA